MKCFIQSAPIIGTLLLKLPITSSMVMKSDFEIAKDIEHRFETIENDILQLCACSCTTSSTVIHHMLLKTTILKNPYRILKLSYGKWIRD